MPGQFAIGILPMHYVACETMAAGHVASDLADLHVASLLGCARPAAWRLAEAFGLAAGPKWLVPERHFGMHEIGQAL